MLSGQASSCWFEHLRQVSTVFICRIETAFVLIWGRMIEKISSVMSCLQNTGSLSTETGGLFLDEHFLQLGQRKRGRVWTQLW